MSGERDPQLDAIVVIPARDEELLIGECLAALAGQRGVEREDFEVLVVLDRCSDATEAVARDVAGRLGLSISFLQGPGTGSGPARALGMDAAHSRLIAAGRPDALIASTDADSRVALDWLSAQLEALRGGAEAIGGEVILDETGAKQLVPETVARRGRDHEARAHDLEEGSEHVHFAGASIGVSARAYGAVGGMRPLRSLEDADFARRLTDAGVAVHRLKRVRVTTSARTDGRAERGLAADLALSEWMESHRLHGAYGLEEVLAAKDRTVSVVLPAREVAGTIGRILGELAPLEESGLIDELLVVDADSADGTAALARHLGATVLSENEILPELGPSLGKGDAMRRGAAATSGEVIAFFDTDSEDDTAGFALGMLGAFFCGPSPRLVKGAFRRPLRVDGRTIDDGGGRVTELVARPLINLNFPALAGLRQPLAGEIAIDRAAFEQLRIPAGYGVEIAMIIDIWRAHGLDSICEVDLGTRQNRHQDLAALGRMAIEVMTAARHRMGSEVAEPDPGALLRPSESGDLTSTPIQTLEREPLAARSRSTA